MAHALNKDEKADYLRRITNTEVHFENLTNDDLDLLFELFFARLPELSEHVARFKAQERVQDVVTGFLGPGGTNVKGILEQFPLVGAVVRTAQGSSKVSGAHL